MLKSIGACLLLVSVIGAEPILKIEPVRLSTPRMAAEAFLKFATAGTSQTSYILAAQCLSLSGLDLKTDETRIQEGAKLAEMLMTALSARGYQINVEGLPNTADVTSGDLQLTLETPQFRFSKAGNLWRLSALSVSQIRPFYDSVISPQARWILEYIPASWRYRVLGIAWWQYAGLLISLLLAFTARRIAIYLSENQLLKLVEKSEIQWDDDIVKAAGRPVGMLVFAGILWVMFPNLQFGVRVSLVARVACVSLMAFAGIWLFYRLVDVLTLFLAELTEHTDTKLDDQIIPIVRKTLKTFVVLIGVIFTLQNLNVDVTSFIAGLGIGGLALALAAKDTLSNLFGSVMILIDRPFQIGDWVIVGDVEGTVEEVGLRSTRIRTFYKSQVTIPNSNLAMVSIDNMGRRSYRRIKTHISLQYDTPPDKIEAFVEGIRQIILANEFTWKDYFHVYLNQFNASSLDVLLYAFVDTDDWGIELRERGRIFLEIIRLADELGASFAFPTQTLHVDSFPGQPSPVTQEQAADELAKIASEFGPGGKLARPEGIDMRDLNEGGER